MVNHKLSVCKSKQTNPTRLRNSTPIELRFTSHLQIINIGLGVEDNAWLGPTFYSLLLDLRSYVSVAHNLSHVSSFFLITSLLLFHYIQMEYRWNETKL